MITAQEMLDLEAKSEIPVINLMENAGKAFAKALKEKVDVKNKGILIIAYHGNNGGDGFVAARSLCDDTEVDVLFVGDETKLTKESSINLKKIENNDKVQMLTLEAVDFSNYDLVIDAIFGTGIHGEINDPLATLIKNLSTTKAYKVSIDIPSGINPDTGEKTNVYFEPDLIIALHDIKKGLENYKDKTIVVDIGIKKQ
ncbi:NAD(P)H-hydrate epimerase [Candidatus Woesearchaeota archaeon]|jgi:NAD(P)H-hydrate epimerase|nr:NAD(P)H-hydrate epimerase [Candidatus Woesearchaeota archaeon]|tara:strand:+ start:2628 stop:3224 length:597 start_codon:yes stop_codon:yes gene_type:complete